MPDMPLPDWKTTSAGTRVRVALWLATEVGEGGTFRKAMLRAAFPGVEQVDRRMRDLRNDGWVLQTYQQDRSLKMDELRLAKIGASVWGPSYRVQADGVPRAERSSALAADDFRCVACGICAGEPYPDQPLVAAQLAVSRDGNGAARAVCAKCRGGVGTPLTAEEFVAALACLEDSERQLVLAWIRAGRRTWSREESLWAQFRWMSAEERAGAKAMLD